ncbi:ATP-binding protein [Bosea sp. TWI1241]|uniref:ATP-binding protein n=1 Tax=Bosea sp. TWI1241 TaxID=3148904 RepID=UPI003208568C
MSGSEQHWTELWQAAAKDAALAPFVAGGALLLCAEDGTLLHADAAGKALLRGESEPALPAMVAQRLRVLAAGAATPGTLRLERLRFGSALQGLTTCACKLVEGPAGRAIALAINAAELRRAGVRLPVQDAPAPATEQQAALPLPALAVAEEPPAQQARPANLRFLWQSDRSGRFTSVSPDFARLAGTEPAQALPGRSWSELIGQEVIDGDGQLSARLAGDATWSGYPVLWRVGPQEAARVELSGFPLFDAERAPNGFRGFGLVRRPENEPLPAAEAPAAAADLDEAANAAQPALAAAAIADLARGSQTAAVAAVPAAPVIAALAPSHEAAPVATDDAAALADSADATAPDLATAPVETAPGQPEAPVADEPEAETETATETVTAPEAAAVDEATDIAEDGADEADGESIAAATMPAREAEEPVAEAPVAEQRATPAPVAGTTSEPQPDEDTAEQVRAARNDATAQSAHTAQSDDAAEAGLPDTNVVQLRNGQFAAIRPVLEPSKANLSKAERNAFREIAKALGARIAGEDEAAPRLPPATPLTLQDERETAQPAAEQPAAPASQVTDPAQVAEPAMEPAEPRARMPNAHAEILDRLPVAVLVNRDDVPLYANRTLLDLLDYADVDDLAACGGVGQLFRGPVGADESTMMLVDRKGGVIAVEGRLSTVSWQGEPATLMAFRNRLPGGELEELTAEEAEERELAAEFAAEEEEAAQRVRSLRLEGEGFQARIAEMSAMLDTATDGVVTVDGRGRILSLNKSAEALFGYDQREVTGELFTLLFAPESHSPALDYLDGLIGGGVASLMNDGREIVGRVRQGGRIPLFMTMGRIAEAPDSKFCAVLRDITAWKKTEGELIEARKIAEKASAQKSDVLAKISHEIRTPLNAIIGFAEVMSEERFGPIENERYKEYLHDIHQSGGYVISLVNDLLDLAKIEAGKLELDFVSVSLNDIALSAVNLLQPEAQRGRVVLRSGLAPKLPPVVADERSLRQIVLNLLSNAVKFTDAGGQVIVSTALGDQGEAILRVRDTGVGMDDSEIALALEPFRRVPTTRKAGGTGLGLPLTKALVEANRAALSITSVKKEGTLVEVTFPPQRVLAG